MSPTVIWVALGGAIGAVTRYWTDAAITRLAGSGFPWGTLTINILGSAIIGIWFAMTPPDRATTASHLFFSVGVLGGFTTFSAFSVQTLLLAQSGEWARAGAYIAASVALCLIGVWIGFQAGAAIR